MKALILSLALLAQAAALQAAPAKKADVDLAGHKGEPVLVFFFSPDTPEALPAAQAVRKLRQDFPSAKLAVLGFTPPEVTQKQLLPFLKSAGVNFPVQADAGSALAQQCKVNGLPHLAVLDRNHRITEWWPGYHPLYEPMIRRAIKSVLR